MKKVLKRTPCDALWIQAWENAGGGAAGQYSIGYADGVKKYESIFIIPTQDRNGYYYGNEYLQLYQRIDRSTYGILCFWKPHEQHGKFASSL